MLGMLFIVFCVFFCYDVSVEYARRSTSSNSNSSSRSTMMVRCVTIITLENIMLDKQF